MFRQNEMFSFRPMTTICLVLHMDLVFVLETMGENEKKEECRREKRKHGRVQL